MVYFLVSDGFIFISKQWMYQVATLKGDVCYIIYKREGPVG